MHGEVRGAGEAGPSVGKRRASNSTAEEARTEDVTVVKPERLGPKKTRIVVKVRPAYI